jgi:hypothetical protein
MKSYTSRLKSIVGPSSKNQNGIRRHQANLERIDRSAI